METKILENKKCLVMLKNFEVETQELDKKELLLLPFVADILKNKIGKENAIKNKTLGIKACNYYQISSPTKEVLFFKISAVRIRKIIHYIRVNKIVPLLCSGSQGYYVAKTRTEAENCIISLKQSRFSISEIAEALENQLQERKPEVEQLKLEI